ncbi:endo-1,4-beta-xylanase [Rheinheimera sp. MM224]|uniref:endo-1,4-beta-xylanase n=1 Tax=Rheinheimera sp. MM224 TaxID=3019969 RepID=UPI0021F8E7E2|nr:endo-1,4-beta-xylanase [Rheinheimera sp. MM224]CAI3806382.1 Endo-1,4-beta-xylanase A [Rheinheimera sp. MM224]
MRSISFCILLSSLLIGSAYAQDQSSPLKQAYSKHFSIGTALSATQIQGKELGTLELVKQQFNAVTAENVMKWEIIEPVEGQFNFAAADAMIEYAEANNINVIGHVLLWHEQTPAWVFQDAKGQPASKELVLSRLKNHINAVMGRYKGRIQGWDAVNEALNEDGTLRQSNWYKALGQDYIATVFELAHQADPKAQLYYNDFNLFKPEKRAGVLKLVAALKAKKAPIYGIGEQGHYSLDYPTLQEVEDSIVAFKNTGLKVMITELDISVLPFPDPDNVGADISLNMKLKQEFNPYADGLPKAVSDQLTQKYLQFFELFLRHSDSIERVTLWGVNDNQTWRNNWPMKGRTDYPLLFDRKNQPKEVVPQLIKLAEKAGK